MHIIFLNPQGNFDAADSHLTEHPDFGGQLVYVKEVAQAMATAGHQVDILTRRIDDPDWPEFAEPIAHYPGFEANLRIVRLDCGGPLFLNKERLWDHMDEFVRNIRAFFGPSLPDFATSHYADGGYCGALLQKLTGMAFTFTGHSLGAQKLDKLGTTRANWQEMETRFRFSRRIAAERLAMRRAFRIVASTGQERREQYAHPLYEGAVDPGDDDRFAVIPPGVNTGIFTTETDDLDAKVRDGLDASLAGAPGPYVIVSNRLDEKKNSIGVVEAFARSEPLRQRASLVLCIRGIDDPFAELDGLPEAEQAVLAPILGLIEVHDLRDRVRFLNIGSQRALAATYRALAQLGSGVALTAFYEPFGLAPIEAAACGLPCVATRNGGPSEIFADGSGVLVDPFDPQDIAAGLLRALEHHADLSAQGQDRVLGTYTWRKTADGYLAVITEGMAAAGRDGDPPPPLDATARIEAYLTPD
ncbi:MAG: glycosyltransferase [Methyloligellaceae bacterium]